ncbi:hypothetical protein SCG7109_AO_00170 [Chlamydiales bacterium SCGC AG-110-M15]|nr:hypothetical protein SCG7109_AO_00170 [Chlamydiales bacterium SCGC AG-110-M15]
MFPLQAVPRSGNAFFLTGQVYLVKEKNQNSSIPAIHTLQQCASHLLAATLVNLFPRVFLLGGGPCREGFFYDCVFPQAIDREVLDHISVSMLGLAKSAQAISSSEMLLPNAISFFKGQKQRVRVGLLEGLADKQALVSLLRIGDFTDLTSSDLSQDFSELDSSTLQYTRLLRLENHTRQVGGESYSVTRIIGVLGIDKKDLKLRVKQAERGMKRYYRNIAKDLGLFEVNEGELETVSYFARGEKFKEALIGEWRALLDAEVFKQVSTPGIVDMATIKHLKDKDWLDIRDDVLLTHRVIDSKYLFTSDSVLQHLALFRSLGFVERDFPLKFAECVQVLQREEPLYPGFQCQGFELIRDTLTQLCTKDQLKAGIISYLKIIKSLITMHGIGCKLRLKMGKLKFLDHTFKVKDCERILLEALEASGLDFEVCAFASPYFGLDVSYVDSLGREWAGAGLTVDGRLPGAFGLAYMDAGRVKRVPFLLRGSIFGSVQRFMSMLLEHYAGEIPGRYVSGMV